MLGSKALFVLGAGVGVDFGLPLGQQLQRKIYSQARIEAEQLPLSGPIVWSQGDRPVSYMLHQRGHDRAAIGKALDRIADGILDSASIDIFLHNNKHDRLVIECGKAAILFTIIQAESATPFYSDQAAETFCIQRDLEGRRVYPPAHIALSYSYLAPIWEELSETYTLENVDQIFEQVTFINFNYDRSLEQGLRYKLQRTFGLPDGRVNTIINSLRVIRPYGTPHGDVPISEASQQFGRPDTGPLAECVENIRTFTEAVQRELADEIKDAVEEARTIVFWDLGFIGRTSSF